MLLNNKATGSPTDDNHDCCDVYRHFLSSETRHLSWKEDAAGTSRDTVCHSAQWVVDYGSKHRNLEGFHRDRTR